MREREVHLPRHVGVVMDGNRRWARAAGLSSPSDGHRQGADHIEHLLDWCELRSIDHLSVFVLSADNIRKRSALEIGFLFGLVADVLPGLVERSGRYAAEAAMAVRDCAAAAGVEHLIALIRPENVPSQGVARKLGMELERRAHVHGGVEALVFGCRL